MAQIKHSEIGPLSGQKVHGPFNWIWADAAAQAAAVVTQMDLYKEALRLDTLEVFVLTSVSPVVWSAPAAAAPAAAYPTEETILIQDFSAPVAANSEHIYSVPLTKKYTEGLLAGLGWVNVNVLDLSNPGVMLGAASFSIARVGGCATVTTDPADTVRVFELTLNEYKDSARTLINNAATFTRAEDVGVVLGFGSRSKDVVLDHPAVYGKQFQIQSVWLDNSGTESVLKIKFKNCSDSSLDIQLYMGFNRIYGFQGRATTKAVFGDTGIAVTDYPQYNFLYSTNKGNSWQSIKNMGDNSWMSPSAMAACKTSGDAFLLAYVSYNWDFFLLDPATNTWLRQSSQVFNQGQWGGNSRALNPGNNGTPYGGHPMDINPLYGGIVAFDEFLPKVYITVDNFANLGNNAPAYDNLESILDPTAVLENIPSGYSMRLSCPWQHPYLRVIDPDNVLVAFSSYAVLQDETHDIRMRKNHLLRTEDGGQNWTEIMQHREFLDAFHQIDFISPNGEEICLAIISDGGNILDSDWSAANITLPVAKKDFALAKQGDRLFIIGGEVDTGDFAPNIHTSLVNTTTGELSPWVLVGTLPEGVSKAKACVHGSFLFIVYGMTAGPVYSGNVVRFTIGIDGALSDMTQLQTFSPPRAGHQLILNGDILSVLGGNDGNGVLQDVQTTTIHGDGTIDDWQLFTQMQYPREDFCACSSNDVIDAFLNYALVFNAPEGYGYPNCEFAMLNSGFPGYFMGDSDNHDAAPGPRKSAALAQFVYPASHDSRLFFTGGHITAYESTTPESGIVWTALIESGSHKPKPSLWKALKPMNVPRSNHEAACVGNFLFVLGGKNSAGLLNSIERVHINATPYAVGAAYYNASTDGGTTWLHGEGAWQLITDGVNKNYSYLYKDALAISEVMIFKKDTNVTFIARNADQIPSITRSIDGGSTWDTFTALAPWAAQGGAWTDVTNYYTRAIQNDANELVAAFSSYGDIQDMVNSNLYIGDKVETFKRFSFFGI